MHISLDGFVCGLNGEMNWIKMNQDLFDHVGERIANTHTSMYGRKTFDLMEGYWPTAGDKPNASKHDKEHAAWYKNAHKVVLSRNLPQSSRSDVQIIGQQLSEQVEEVKRQSSEEILLFGSPTATHALLQERLIDGFWLFLNPVILGEGIPLFHGIKAKMELELLPESKVFDIGVRELSYEVKK